MSTIAAIATPPGRGGVGVVRISGPAAFAVVAAVTRRDEPLPPRRALLRTWFDADGDPIDEGLLLAFPAPGSYTGEDVVELQGHGSPVLLRRLLVRLFELGCRPAEAGEFTRRAVGNGRMDLSRAEAVVACIDAATERAARQANRQLRGELGRRVNRFMDVATGLAAHVEAWLDFPDEEVPEPLFSELERRARDELVDPIRRWLTTAPVGERLFEGVHVAIIGAPNVGKSSLLNRLAGRDRAIVSDVAGTTRDTLEIDFEIAGVPMRLVDTAGLRDGGDRIEAEGVRRAAAAADSADLVLFVADATRPETWAFDGTCDLRIANKCDLLSDRGVLPGDVVPLSAATGEGVESLRHLLAERLGDVSGEEELFVTRARHRDALERAAAHLEEGIARLGDEAELELVALEWRRAWSALGEIVGVGDVERILDRVFADFCIGK